VEELRQNDPARRCFCIYLRNETSDEALAQALEQNPFVTKIELNLNDAHGLDWNSFLRVIATRSNLEEMTLRNTIWAEQRIASVALVSAILQAIQQNTAIRNVSLLCLRLPADISTFVDMASSITSFTLYTYDMKPAEQEQGTRDLAAALQRNTNIKTLRLWYENDIYGIPILQSLQSNRSLKSLSLGGPNFSEGTTRAIEQLLESTRSIQSLDFSAPNFGRDGFHAVAQGIINSRNVSELNFSFCSFTDEESTACFRSILLKKRNLTSLCLNHCQFQGDQVHETIISTLFLPDSPLRRFGFEDTLLGDVLSNGQFQNLLRAIEKSKLEHFAIGSIRNQQQLRTLTESILKMRIKELKVVICNEFFDEENVEQLLLLAVKNNFSLRSVQGDHELDSIFDDDDKTRLAFFADRNERLDQWVDNPEMVEQKVWPEALKLADWAGPSSFFRGLRSVLGGDSADTLRGRRKRKRPTYYTPS